MDKSAYFQNKRIWLTGASSGIGLALARELLSRGARLAVSARTIGPLEALANEFGEDRVLVLPCDVSTKEDNQRAISEILAGWDGLDIALLNAGTCEYLDVHRFDSALFERMIQTNFLGMVYGIEAALPALRASDTPQLVGMSSTVAYLGLPRGEAYSASKAAIRNMLEGLRLDLHAERIPVSIICPGFVKTPLTDQNDFPMPFRVDAEKAARIIADGIASQKHEIHFPKRFSLMLKFLALLPSPWRVRLLARTA